jgi:dTDP-4-dehydrorhamnose 3,5-epimerase
VGAIKSAHYILLNYFFKSCIITMTPQGIRQLVIPTGVWHMNVNISKDETFLINHPTEVYHHEAPDRYLLDWNTKDIPFNVSSVFPKNYAGCCE